MTVVVVVALVLTVLAPVWAAVAAVVDLVARRRRLPTVRIVALMWWWSLLEVVGVAAAGGLWLTGQSRNQRAHYALQRWWAARLVAAVCRATGLRIHLEGTGALGEGPAVCLGRHASMGDALVAGWLFASVAGRNPRFVMKRELLWDPCLDIVGHRLPNYFVDRSSTSPETEVAGIRAMGDGLGAGDVAVIFPEGTRASDTKRASRLARLAETAPGRHATLAGLTHLLPPRSAGAAALLGAAPDADVVLMWHVGFDGLDSPRGIWAQLVAGDPGATVVLSAHARSGVPAGAAFVAWLDDQWVAMDAEVAAASGLSH